MTPKVAVIISTYNPRPDYLNRVHEALKTQTLPYEKWELVIIDNCSTDKSVFESLDLSWHPHARICEEKKQGLTHARLKGFAESTAPLICMLDDDNVLRPDYLEKGTEVFRSHHRLGAIGGKIILEYESPPADWILNHLELLAIQDHGDYPLMSEAKAPTSNQDYPRFAPVGAGMILKREVVDQYQSELDQRESVLSDRKGGSLSSAGDNDIVIVAMKNQWFVGYDPELKLDHLIPVERLSLPYLSKMSEQSSKSWIELLSLHGLCPWPVISPVSVPFRKLKAWFSTRAWKSPSHYVRWKACCGIFEGQSELKTNRRRL